MNERHAEVLKVLADANPVPLAAVAGAVRGPEARRLYAAITSERTAPERRLLPRLRVGRRLVATAASAAALAAAATAVVTTFGPESRLGAEPAAAQALLAASRVAASQPAHLPEPGEYYYSRSRSLALTTAAAGGRAWSTLTPSVVEVWFALDGSGRVREGSGEPKLVGPSDRADWRAAGSPPLQVGERTSDQLFKPGELAAGRVAEADLARLSALPNDADPLAEAIRADVAGKGRPEDVPGLMFQEIASLLADPAAAPDLRAALFEAASTIEGVELLGSASDRAGRLGTRLAIESSFGGHRTRYEMVFEPKTSHLLETETTLLDRVAFVDAPPPATIGYTTYLFSGIAPSVKEAPSE